MKKSFEFPWAGRLITVDSAQSSTRPINAQQTVGSDGLGDRQLSVGDPQMNSSDIPPVSHPRLVRVVRRRK